MKSPMDYQTLIGIILGLVTAAGGLVARDRHVLGKIQSGDDQLHERVNRVRDEYVRRIDLDAHIVRLDASVQKLSEEISRSSTATNQRLDALLAYMVKERN